MIKDDDETPHQEGDAAPNDMSDEEARRLMAEMDQPLPESSPDSEDPPNLASWKGTEGGPLQNQKNLYETSETVPKNGEIEELSANDFASDPDMLADFALNAEELVQTLDQAVLELEKDPESRATIEAIFRSAHTLKGAAGMFGFRAIERLMHRMEELFDRIRKGRLLATPQIIDVVLRGVDTLRVLLGAALSGQPSGAKTGPLIDSFEAILEHDHQHSPPPESALESSEPPPPPLKIEKTPPIAAEAGPPREAPSSSTSPSTSSTPPASPKSGEPSTLRVDLEKLDALVNLVGELVIDRTKFAAIEAELRSFNPQIKGVGKLSETVQQFGRHMTDLHDMIMKVRMVPIGHAFSRFSRVVRDLARQLGKSIELRTEGEDTELDKTIVEQIGDPLIHLIRNSCDHGIESPEVRQAKGKPKVGSITLTAKQEGHYIVITIKDDGKGLDLEKIRKRAVEKGLIAGNVSLSREAIMNLIFEAGFSTADAVTNVSGRGVGMDVVRKQIAALKGIIDLDSAIDQGTTTKIRLPLTLAIVPSLLIESGQSTFAIPLSSVVESLRIPVQDIVRIGGAEAINRHQKVIPLAHLHQILNLDQMAQDLWYHQPPEAGKNPASLESLPYARKKRQERLYVVVVGSGERRLGLVVKQLLTQQDMVIKPLGSLLKRVPCVSGGAVLGNGDIVLALDIAEIEATYRHRGSKPNLKSA